MYDDLPLDMRASHILLDMMASVREDAPAEENLRLHQLALENLMISGCLDIAPDPNGQQINLTPLMVGMMRLLTLTIYGLSDVTSKPPTEILRKLRAAVERSGRDDGTGDGTGDGTDTADPDR